MDTLLERLLENTGWPVEALAPIVSGLLLRTKDKVVREEVYDLVSRHLKIVGVRQRSFKSNEISLTRERISLDTRLNVLSPDVQGTEHYAYVPGKSRFNGVLPVKTGAQALAILGWQPDMPELLAFISALKRYSRTVQMRRAGATVTKVEKNVRPKDMPESTVVSFFIRVN